MYKGLFLSTLGSAFLFFSIMAFHWSYFDYDEDSEYIFFIVCGSLFMIVGLYFLMKDRIVLVFFVISFLIYGATITFSGTEPKEHTDKGGYLGLAFTIIAIMMWFYNYYSRK